jgi:hypothetical protein
MYYGKRSSRNRKLSSPVKKILLVITWRRQQVTVTPISRCRRPTMTRSQQVRLGWYRAMQPRT